MFRLWEKIIKIKISEEIRKKYKQEKIKICCQYCKKEFNSNQGKAVHKKFKHRIERGCGYDLVWVLPYILVHIQRVKINLIIPLKKWKKYTSQLFLHIYWSQNMQKNTNLHYFYVLAFTRPRLVILSLVRVTWALGGAPNFGALSKRNNYFYN